MQVGGYCLAPKIIVDQKKTIRFMYREEADNVYDSGWRFFSGNESDEYVNNPDNIGLYDLATIIGIHPYVCPYLTFPVGSILESKNGQDFYSVSDFY